MSLMISAIEHLFMSIGHLYVLFGEVSIQVVGPFFSLDCLGIFGIKFNKFFINFGY